eukprot:jgi/Tetstr1/465048/TSEL_009776.t1
MAGPRGDRRFYWERVEGSGYFGGVGERMFANAGDMIFAEADKLRGDKVDPTKVRIEHMVCISTPPDASPLNPAVTARRPTGVAIVREPDVSYRCALLFVEDLALSDPVKEMYPHIASMITLFGSKLSSRNFTHPVVLDNPYAVPGFAEYLAKRTHCVPFETRLRNPGNPIRGDVVSRPRTVTKMAIFRKYRSSSAYDLVCSLTLGFNHLSSDLRALDFDAVMPRDEACFDHMRSRMKPRASFRDACGKRWAATDIVVARRKCALKSPPPRHAQGAVIVLDRPVVYITTGNPTASDPFRISVSDTPRVPACRLNKLQENARFSYRTTFWPSHTDHVDSMHFRFQVYFVYEIGYVGRAEELCRETMPLCAPLAQAGSLKVDRAARRIQLWWRSVACNPHHPAGDRILRRAFEAEADANGEGGGGRPVYARVEPRL